MEINKPSLPSLRDIINQHKLSAKKSLGQHFLLNESIIWRIVKAAGNLEGVTILEIGPGPGGLTRCLLEARANVVAIEHDHRCQEILKNIQQAYEITGSQNTFKVIEGDALTISPQIAVPDGPIKIVANLPYNVGTALLLQWLHNLERIMSLTLMFQKEVALRLIAKPRTKNYGRLSVLAQWLCESQKLFDLPPGAFTPAPKVMSSIVRLIPKPLTSEEKMILPKLSDITRYAFGQRRKMLRSSLKPLFSESMLKELGINPCCRAEELTIKDFVLLAQCLQEKT